LLCGVITFSSCIASPMVTIMVCFTRILIPIGAWLGTGCIKHCVQVANVVRDVARRVMNGNFSVPQYGLEQLRQMLAMGPYQFLNTPPPKSQQLITEDEVMQVGAWNRQKAIDDADIDRVVRKCCLLTLAHNSPLVPCC
jgi:hypothetical protein